MANERAVECERCGGRGLHDCVECSGLGHDGEGNVCVECKGDTYTDCDNCDRKGYVNG